MSTITSMDVDQIGNGWRIQKSAAITKMAMTRISSGFSVFAPVRPRASEGMNSAAIARTDAMISLMNLAFVISFPFYGLIVRSGQYCPEKSASNLVLNKLTGKGGKGRSGRETVHSARK